MKQTIQVTITSENGKFPESLIAAFKKAVEGMEGVSNEVKVAKIGCFDPFV